jgi:plastocyanin
MASIKFSFFAQPYLSALALVAGLAVSSSAHAALLAVEVLDAAGKPVADAVVYAEAEGAVGGSGAVARSMPQVEIEQKALKFVPLVTAIQTGSAIMFPNKDTVRHHIYSFSTPKPFEQKLYSGVPDKPVVFDKPGTVVLGCNIHDRMLAYVVIVDTPYFAKTDANGRATIDGPPGKYRLKTWHADLATGDKPEQAQTLAASDSKAVVKLVLRARAPEGDARPLDYKY